MKKTQEQVFLQVKQRLDYYRLPTIFSYEDVGLLSKILTLLDKHARKDGKQNHQSNRNLPASQLNDALRLQIGKVVKENNRLHMDLISAKEQILTLKHQNDKLLIDKSGGTKQTTLLLQAQRKREDQLFEELTQVKYKYNQLMDLVHQDSEIEKKYIKRLMKHKKMEIQQKKQHSRQKQFKKGPHQTTTDLEAKVILLQNKLANRQSEIMRLQKRSQYDGLNMNKILKDFHNQRSENKMEALQQQVHHLEEQNKKMKDQVSSFRKKGGSKQALREEMRKNHETINKISNENKQLKRKLKEKQFDINVQSKLGKRQIQMTKNITKNVESENELLKLTIEDLNKKIDFLKGQLQFAKNSFEKQRKLNVQKDVVIDKIKNSEEGQKILTQYEVQSLKQRVEQLQTQLDNSQQRVNQLLAQNDYHKKEDKLKNQAIQNLEKIVDELMKRNNNKTGPEVYLSQSQSVSLQNTIALRKNLAEIKQHLAMCQNDKQRLQRQLETLVIRFEQKSAENSNLNEQLNRFKIKMLDMRNNQEQFNLLQREIATLQSDLKKQQNFRYKIDQMHQQAENDKARLRKQLQQVTQQYEIYERKSKNHMNSQKMQINELQESNQMLEIRLKQKQKKIILCQERIVQLAGKNKIMKDQIALLEDQKHVAVRDKHKFEKRCEEMLKLNEEAAIAQMKSQNADKKQMHSQILQYQKQIQKLRERIARQNEQILQLNTYCDVVRMSEDNLKQENSSLKRQNQNLRIGSHQEAQEEQEEE